MNSNRGTPRLIAAAALWAAAVLATAFYTMLPFWPRGLGLAAVLAGMVAACITMDLRVERYLLLHRLRVQEIMAVTEAEHHRDGVTPIH